MVSTGITSSLVNYPGSNKDVFNSVPSLTAREYGYPANLSYANHQTIDYLIKGRFNLSNGLYSKDLYAHYGCINAIEFSNNGQLMISGGDDRRVLLWNVEKALSDKGDPLIMKGEHTSNIFCLEFDSCNRHIFSGGNDEQVIIHDIETREPIKVISHQEAVYCLSVDPSNDNLFATACDEGRIFLFDMRESYNMDNLPGLIHTRSAFHAVMHNPREPRLIVTANAREGISLWDIRKPQSELIKYNGGLVPSQSAMSVRFNSNGTKILALRRRLPAILYNTLSPHPIAEFDHKDYYNSCTMKSCCFAGSSDEYILSGSDDFRLYMWRIPDELMDKDYTSDGIKWIDSTHLILRGHRSIVNQVRYNYANSTIASSGVEKVIKVWSLFDIFDPSEDTTNKNVTNHNNRKVYSHEDYIQLVLESGQLAAHDYSNQSIQEDPRMMAFFDSLVQRDIEGWTTDSSDDDSDYPRFSLISTKSAAANSYSDKITSTSDFSSSSDGENDSLNLLDSQTVNYIQSFSERMEASVNKLCNSSSLSRSSQPNSCEPSTSSGQKASSSLASVLLAQESSSTAAAAKPDSVSSNNNGRSDRKEGTDRNIDSATNRISQLINEKKKDQLRKVARCALKSTRLRLRKLKRHLAREKNKKPVSSSSLAGSSRAQSDPNENDSYLNDKVKIKNQLENVLTILERLSQKVDSGCKNGRKSLHKMRSRLRYLTNRSDILFAPENGAASDSDEEDSPLITENDFLMMNDEVQRVVNLLSNGRPDDHDGNDDDREHISSHDNDDDNNSDESICEDRSLLTSIESDSSNSTDSTDLTNKNKLHAKIRKGDDTDNSSSSSSSEEENESRKRRRRKKASERLKHHKSNGISLTSDSSSDSSDSYSDSDSDSNDNNNNTNGYLKPNSDKSRLLLPRIKLCLDDDYQSDDEGFDADTESAKKKSSTTNSLHNQSNCKQHSPSSHLPQFPCSASSSSFSSSEILATSEEQKKPLTSDVNFKTVNNSARCYRKRKSIDTTTETDNVYKKKQIKPNQE